MYPPAPSSAKLLLIDTCDDAAGIAITHGATVVSTRDLPSRSASASIITALKEVLQDAGLALSDLDAVGVVAGPGSFTGMRTGMAAAKGLCEASSLPLVAVSRLAVLLHSAASPDALAALDAGRGDVYQRSQIHDPASEGICTIEALTVVAEGRRIIVAEAGLAQRIASLHPELHTLSVTSALPLVLAQLALPFTDVALIEANYLRDERNMYLRPAPPAAPPAPLP